MFWPKKENSQTVQHKRGTKKNVSPQQELNPQPLKHQMGALSTELIHHLYSSITLIMTSTVPILAVYGKPVT